MTPLEAANKNYQYWVDEIAQALDDCDLPSADRLAFADRVVRSVGRAGLRGRQRDQQVVDAKRMYDKSVSAHEAARALVAEYDSSAMNVTGRLIRRDQRDRIHDFGRELRRLRLAAWFLLRKTQRDTPARRGPRNIVALEIAQAVALEYRTSIGQPTTSVRSIVGKAEHRAGLPQTDFDKVCDVVERLLLHLGRHISISDVTRRAVAPK